MQRVKLTWIDRVRKMFGRSLKPFLVDEKYKVITAFTLHGTTYRMFDSANEVPTGRFFAAMGIYAEMEMNADKEYLQSHCKAMEKILSDPKKISIQYIAQININLKERLELMPFPDYIYKLASVIFFDDSESLYSYDYTYNAEKIKKWKAAGGALDFFSKTPLRELVPSLQPQNGYSQIYLQASQLISETHHRLLTDILSDGNSEKE